MGWERGGEKNERIRVSEREVYAVRDSGMGDAKTETYSQKIDIVLFTPFQSMITAMNDECLRPGDDDDVVSLAVQFVSS